LTQYIPRGSLTVTLYKVGWILCLWTYKHINRYEWILGRPQREPHFPHLKKTQLTTGWLPSRLPSQKF